MDAVVRGENMLADMRDIAGHRPETTTFNEILRDVESLKRLRLLQQRNSLGTALHCVCSRGYTDLAKCIIASLDPKDRLSLYMVPNDCRVTALHAAARERHHDVVQLLLESVSHNDRVSLLKVRDVAEYTPLHYAASNDDVETLEAILDLTDQAQQGELLAIQNRASQNILDTAVQFNCMRSVRCIQEYQPIQRRRNQRLLKRRSKDDSVEIAELKESLKRQKQEMEDRDIRWKQEICALMSRVAANEVLLMRQQLLPFSTPVGDGGEASGDEPFSVMFPFQAVQAMPSP